MVWFCSLERCKSGLDPSRDVKSLERRNETLTWLSYTYILRIFVIIIIIMLGLMVCESHCNGNVDADAITLVSDGGGGDEDDDQIIRCGNDGYSAVREMDGDPEEARRMIDSRLGALHSEVIVILPTLITEMRKINPLLKVLAFHAKEVECNVKTLWSSFVTRTPH